MYMQLPKKGFWITLKFYHETFVEKSSFCLKRSGCIRDEQTYANNVCSLLLTEKNYKSKLLTVSTSIVLDVFQGALSY